MSSYRMKTEKKLKLKTIEVIKNIDITVERSNDVSINPFEIAKKG